MQRQRHPDGLVHGVIVAVRREDGRWLLIRRSRQVAAPLAICFPGGGIELGEAHAVAAAREFREELAGEIEPLCEVWQWHAPDRPLYLFGWYARLISPVTALKPDPLEVAEMLWLTPEETRQHPQRLIGTECFVDALMNHVQQQQQ